MDPTEQTAYPQDAAMGEASSPDNTGSVSGPRASGMSRADVSHSGRTSAPPTMGVGHDTRHSHVIGSDGTGHSVNVMYPTSYDGTPRDASAAPREGLAAAPRDGQTAAVMGTGQGDRLRLVGVRRL